MQTGGDLKVFAQVHFSPKTPSFCTRSATATQKTTLHSEAHCAVSLFASRAPLMRVASVRHDSGAQITGILTRPSQLGSARWAGIGGGRGLQAHFYSPGRAVKAGVRQTRGRGRAAGRGARGRGWGGKSGTPFSFAAAHW